MDFTGHAVLLAPAFRSVAEKAEIGISCLHRFNSRALDFGSDVEVVNPCNIAIKLGSFCQNGSMYKCFILLFYFFTILFKDLPNPGEIEFGLGCDAGIPEDDFRVAVARDFSRGRSSSHLASAGSTAFWWRSSEARCF
jgi:hypothetical protein